MLGFANKDGHNKEQTHGKKQMCNIDNIGGDWKGFKDCVCVCVCMCVCVCVCFASILYPCDCGEREFPAPEFANIPYFTLGIKALIVFYANLQIVCVCVPQKCFAIKS